MVSFILDASAVIRYIDGEPGMDRVEEILNGLYAGEVEVLISSMHWGEVMGILFKRHGLLGATFTCLSFAPSNSLSSP